MCGRFKRKSVKKKVVQVFEVTAGVEEADFAPGDDLRPQSMQPIIYLDDHGERCIKMIRWGFRLPDRLLFNARSKGIAQANFWKDAFLTGRAMAGPLSRLVLDLAEVGIWNGTFDEFH